MTEWEHADHKLEHACLILEEQGQKVVIDPGFYTRALEGLSHVVAIVITHVHEDHCSEEQIERILKSNPNAKIYGTDEVCKKLTGLNTTSVHHGDFYEHPGFTLEFFGDMHAEIHRSIPLIQNCGVMINDSLLLPRRQLHTTRSSGGDSRLPNFCALAKNWRCDGFCGCGKAKEVLCNSQCALE